MSVVYDGEVSVSSKCYEPWTTYPADNGTIMFRYYSTWRFWQSCPKCGKCIECGDRYCRHCGAQLFKVCPHCGKEI